MYYKCQIIIIIDSFFLFIRVTKSSYHTFSLYNSHITITIDIKKNEIPFK